MLYYVMTSPLYQVICASIFALVGAIAMIHFAAIRIHRLLTKNKRRSSGNWYL
jgi:hypothetical protein